MVPFYVLSGPEKLHVVVAGLPTTARVLVLGKLFVGPGYLVAAIRLLRQARDSASLGELDARRRAEVLWLGRALLALASVGILMVSLALAGAAGLELPIGGDDLGGIFITASTFVVGAFLIRHQPASEGRPEPRPRKYATSPLDQRKKDDGLTRLARVMEERAPHRDPNLTLDELARLVGLPPNHLSQLLNEAVGLSFYDFLSRYRVEAAKLLLADPASAHRTVLAIGHAAGFNSKSSFNRAFKRLTGFTPTEYARRASRAEPEASLRTVSLDPASRP
ncbi:MAG: helix-turn-helix domain-containing protein [Gemmatimonadales bacterium]